MIGLLLLQELIKKPLIWMAGIVGGELNDE